MSRRITRSLPAASSRRTKIVPRRIMKFMSSRRMTRSLNTSKFVTTPNKYFISAHGTLSHTSFAVPTNTVIIFMTYAGSVTLKPLVSNVLRSEHSARDLIEQKHGLYSVTYHPGDIVQDHRLSFPLNEQGRGIWKVPLDDSFVCRPYSENPRLDDLKYMQNRKGKEPKDRHHTMLSEVVRYIRSRVDTSEPLVIFCGSCRATTKTMLYESCKQKNNAVCHRKGIPTSKMSLKEARNLGRSDYRKMLLLKKLQRRNPSAILSRGQKKLLVYISDEHRRDLVASGVAADHAQ